MTRYLSQSVGRGLSPAESERQKPNATATLYVRTNPKPSPNGEGGFLRSKKTDEVAVADGVCRYKSNFTLRNTATP